jgi:hypothetical protein
MGQPELEGILDSPRLRQLKQRISLRCQLLPLDKQQTTSYVLSRLERAGAKPELPIFEPEAMIKIFEYSCGIPRIVNNLCENSMVNAFARQQRNVTGDMITEVAADFRLTTAASTREEPVEAGAVQPENNESVLRSLFRALRTLDNAQSLEEKSVPSADGRRV